MYQMTFLVFNLNIQISQLEAKETPVRAVTLAQILATVPLILLGKLQTASSPSNRVI